MKLVLAFALCLLICYMHGTSSESSTTKKSPDKLPKEKKQASTKTAGGNTVKINKNKDFMKSASAGEATKEKNQKFQKDAGGYSAPKDAGGRDATKAKRSPQLRTPFDKVLDKLSNCASSSPSLVEVVEENLKELQSDEKYTALFHAAPHTAAFLKKKKKDSTKFIPGLQQALGADWSNPAWKSADEIDTLFRPFKQQFVYAMMRFNCTS